MKPFHFPQSITYKTPYVTGVNTAIALLFLLLSQNLMCDAHCLSRCLHCFNGTRFIFVFPKLMWGNVCAREIRRKPRGGQMLLFVLPVDRAFYYHMSSLSSQHKVGHTHTRQVFLAFFLPQENENK